MKYDIIGDIHGHALALEKLLQSLGYSEKQGVYSHVEKNRIAVFVGDLVDRGPEIPRTLQIVKRMHEAHQALVVLGNHEYNLVAFFTPLDEYHRKQIEKDIGPVDDELYVRSHSKRHVLQCSQTVQQFAGREDELESYLQWMKSLPFFLDLAGIRVVHAAWHPQAIKTIREYSAKNCLTESLLQDSCLRCTPAYDAVEFLLKGVELDLPEGIHYSDKEGSFRKRSRIRWWINKQDYSQDIPLFRLLFPPGIIPQAEIADVGVSIEELQHVPGYDNAKPLFMGHYWLGEPIRLLSPYIACLDFSIAAGGMLVAYSWRGEKELDSLRFTAVDVQGNLLLEAANA